MQLQFAADNGRCFGGCLKLAQLGITVQECDATIA